MLFQNTVTMSPETVRLALASMIEITNFDHHINTYPRTRFARHPFGLETPNIERSIGEHQFSVIGNIGATDLSVNGMKAYIMRFLKPAPESVTYLRIIHVPAARNIPDRHDVYFEIGFYRRLIFISGGCTDYDGTAGGEGKLEMERIFTLLAYAYKKPIENIEIEHEKGEKFRATMFKRGM